MRVLICDDHPVVRDGLRLLFGELDALDIEVVGEAGSGEEAIAEAVRLEPDVVIMDLHLPGMSGIDATRAIRTKLPGTGVLVLTMVEDDSALLAALRAGAGGYLRKGAGHADVERALAAVHRGDVMVAAPMADRLRAGLLGTGVSGPFPDLTTREREVLERVARGQSNDQIARSLFLSVKTVRNNVSAILAKLGVDNRAAAVALARDAGMGQSL